MAMNISIWHVVWRGGFHGHWYIINYKTGEKI